MVPCRSHVNFIVIEPSCSSFETFKILIVLISGLYPGNPNKFYLRLTKVDTAVCIKYSMDNITWHLLRLCQFPKSNKYFVGLMCCTPKRAGLNVKFSDITISKPQKDILHSN